MADIDEVAQMAYHAGVDPIDFAIEITRQAIGCRDTLLDISPELPYEDDETLARRVIGRILDAGWTPPAELLAED